MTANVPNMRFFVEQRPLQGLRQGRSADVRMRYLIVLNLSHGRSTRDTATMLGVHNTTVYRVAKRFRASGKWGLLDGREENGTTKLDEHFLDVLYRLVVATRQCWTERSESCDDFMKFGLSSSGCESRPIKAEPGRSVVSLAVAPVMVRLMRR